MDILLTHGYFLEEDAREMEIMRPYAPLGLLYLSAYLKRAGFGPEVFDSTFESRAALHELIEKERPVVVGIYANLMTRPSVVELVRFCGLLEIPVVLGGPEPASYPLEYLGEGASVVVAGEAEQTLTDLLRASPRLDSATFSSIPGLTWLDGNGLVSRSEVRPHIQNLDELPFPDRAAIDIPQYLAAWREHHGYGSVSMIASRGCPYTCTWCSHGVFGYSLRLRSPGNVADELEHVVQTYAPDSIWYSDDVFAINRKWLREYALELERRDLHIPFETISREDRLDEGVIATLASMGCKKLWIGSESGSQRVLDAMQRKTNASRVREVIGLLQGHGIEAGLFLMLGYDGETVDDIGATVDLVTQAVPDALLTTVSYPIKGTPYYEQVEDRIRPGGDWALTSDRELEVAGRPSGRFYAFADRWLKSEYQLKKLERQGSKDRLAMLRALLNARIGRLGMHLCLGVRAACSRFLKATRRTGGAHFRQG